jgi:predicted CopG family antitoxin
MAKQIRKTISMKNDTFSKLVALAADYEGNVSMVIRRLIEEAYKKRA